MGRRGINVVSLFDGISCGRVALERVGISVNRYAAFEIDKYAKAVSRYNYPDIEQYGDVLDADFSDFSDIDLVMGGSPCTFYTDNLVIPNFRKSLIHKGFCYKNSE